MRSASLSSCPNCSLCTARSSYSPRHTFRPSPAPLVPRRSVWYASADENGSVVTDEGIKRPSPLKGTKLKRVERLGAESWAGVAAVDRGESGQLVNWKKKPWRGPADSRDLQHSFAIFGWAVASGLTGAYSGNSKDRSIGKAANTAARAWILAVPVALVLRSIQRGYIPDKSFVIVSFIATGVLLIGWRSALAAATQKSNQGQERQNKHGNPLEFLQLLASLTKRW